MSKLYPVGSMILIEPEVQPDMTKGGLFMPVKERPARGKVIQIPDKLETSLTVGSTVLFPPNALKQFVIDDELHCAVAEEKIYCYIK